MNREDRIPDGRRGGVFEVERCEIKLAFANAMHQLDARNRGRGASKPLETKHDLRPGLDVSMVSTHSPSSIAPEPAEDHCRRVVVVAVKCIDHSARWGNCERARFGGRQMMVRTMEEHSGVAYAVGSDDIPRDGPARARPRP